MKNLSLRLVSAVFISLMLLVATATERSPAPVVEEPRTCNTQSKYFDGGICLNSNHCAIICRHFEGFEGGHCRGLVRRCYCTKHCT
ncbi:unnamed protein product [Thlaspi arvense]|uniref:Knottins-like domain-containing protein n=1 Tax=Thlaspi arvense TaxID=13288 RepID=A0AAU9RLJ2_THLAR|nr:unnamed protein product [Thlaspi arvense]